MPFASVAGVSAGTSNTFTALQTFMDAGIKEANASTGFTTYKCTSSSSSFTVTFPANTGIVAELNYAQTWTAVQTFGNNLNFGGATAVITSLTTNDYLKYNGTNWINAPVSGGNYLIANPSDAAQVITSGATRVMLGYGSTLHLTTSTNTSGKIRIFITGRVVTSTVTQQITYMLRYGTGSAPANNDAETGTQITPTGTSYQASADNSYDSRPCVYFVEVTGLAASTAYWFDFSLQGALTPGGTIKQVSAYLVEV